MKLSFGKGKSKRTKRPEHDPELQPEADEPNAQEQSAEQAPPDDLAKAALEAAKKMGFKPLKADKPRREKKGWFRRRGKKQKTPGLSGDELEQPLSKSGLEEGPEEGEAESQASGKLRALLKTAKNKDEGGAADSGSSSKGKKKKSKLPPLKKRDCFVLMIGDEGGILTLIQGGKVVRRLYAPSAEKQHIKSFMQLLKTNPKVPLYILCDMIDQSYVRHSLPPVSSLSINKLVQRRLKRDFAPEDLKGAIQLNRDKTGRREWNYLLISLANSDTLQQWMEPILEMPNQCKGVYLVPVEAQSLILNISQCLMSQESEIEESQWRILVAHDKVGGVRQIVVKDGQLIFTRLTQYPTDISPQIMAGNIEQEVQNTIEYLRRMAFDESAGLDIFVVVAQDVRDQLDMSKAGATLVKLFTPYEMSKLLRLPQSALSADRYADVVMSTNFGLRQKPKLKLMTAYAKKLEQLYMGRLALRGLGAAAAVYLIYSMGSAMVSWYDNTAQNADLKTRIVTAEVDLKNIQDRIEKLGADQTKVMRVSSLYKTITQPDLGAIQFVKDFSRIKGRNIRVKEWKWGRYESTQRAVSPRHRSNKKNAEPQYEFQLTLEMMNHRGDRRNLRANVFTLVEQINVAFPQYEVEVGQLPGDGEEKNIVIDLDAPLESEEARYRLKPGEEIVRINLAGPFPEKEKKI